MIYETHCSGLTASWVNAWLAAVGITALDSRLALHWTEQDSPIAVISSKSIDPIKAVTDVWPNADFLADLPIADNWHGQGEFRRKVSIEQFIERVRTARSHQNVWTISSTMTDLSVQQNGEVAHAPFDPAGPGTIKWLHHRLTKLHELIGSISEDRICESLSGQAPRIKNNGLGFDSTRLGSLADGSDIWVEPIIEFLAFFGLSIIPMRGPGVDFRLSKRVRSDERQKSWRRRKSQLDARRRCFVWPAWKQPLNSAGIDALLDLWRPWNTKTWSSLGVHSGWQTVQYKNRGSADPTRAFGTVSL